MKRQRVTIESPMVGRCYLSPAPDAPSFVTVGSSVEPGTTVCVIEAMKVFTEIPAGGRGEVTEILAENGQDVEYGQPLIRVSTTEPDAFSIQHFEEFSEAARAKINQVFGG